MKKLILVFAVLCSISTGAKNIIVNTIEGIPLKIAIEYGEAHVMGKSPTTAEGVYVSPSSKVITIPNEVEDNGNTFLVRSIEKEAFKYASYTEIILPDSLLYIKDGAFKYCTSLTRIDLPSSLWAIRESAFQDCQSLTSISIPGSVYSIGNDAFTGCNLKSLILEDGDDQLTVGNNPSLNKTDGNYLVNNNFRGIFYLSDTPQLEEVYIGRDISYRYDLAPFINLSSLKSVVFGNHVTSIPNNLFLRCVNLSSVQLSNSIVSIGACAFEECTGLVSISLPDFLSSIGAKAFHNCTALATIDVPNTISSIGNMAFENCLNLTEFDIPNSLDTISNNCFASCNKLLSIDIPSSVSSIGIRAFNCSGLTSVTIPETVTTIGQSAFSGCANLTNIIINDGVGDRYIESSAFRGCGLLQNVIIPEGIVSIGEYAFADCNSLISITLPNTLEIIKQYAFWGCNNLSSVTLPKSVSKIDYYAFYECNNIRSVNVQFNNPLPIAYATFTTKNATLYVPYGKTDAFKSATNWKSFNPIIEKDPEVGVTFSASLLNGNSPTEALYEVTQTDPYSTQLYKVDTNIIGDISIPKIVSGYDGKIFSVVGIEDSAFSGCTGIKVINIPAWITKIGKAFEGCSGLQQVNMACRNPKSLNVASECFDNIPEETILYVPAGTKERYEAIDAWRNFSQIIESSPISVGDITTKYGASAKLPINLRNDEEIAGLQFRLTLPDGVSVADENGYLKATTTERTQGMTIMGRKDPDSDNSYLFVVFSLNGQSIQGAEGTIMNAILNVAEDVDVGEYEVNIDEVYLAAASLETLSLSPASSALTVSDIVMGDTNGDGKVSIFDAVQVVNYILGNSQTGFIAAAADIDGNGKITIFDAVSIVNIILSQGSNSTGQ